MIAFGGTFCNIALGNKQTYINFSITMLQGENTNKQTYVNTETQHIHLLVPSEHKVSKIFALIQNVVNEAKKLTIQNIFYVVQNF